MAWIKYKYTCRYQANGTCTCNSPHVDIDLSYGGKSIKVVGLIDSGCEITNVNAEIADFFGIDLNTCTPIKMSGSTGEATVHMFNSKIKMKLKDQGDEFESPAIFVRDLPVPLLLGQDNFFEKFKIKFEKHNNTFELSRV
ncbi:hypothetical protein KW782_02695 [Candidatus Parcubacteria bacterium]|nr:hypothetical protein [Candidatus Parcubacteria bacterium]